MTAGPVLDGVPYTDPAADDFTAYLQAQAGGWRTFTPELRDQGAALDYVLGTDDDFDTTYYGDGSFGRWRRTPGGAEEYARLITGSQFGTVDEGSGWYYIPLQATVAPWVTGRIGSGQVVVTPAAGDPHFATVKFEIDPVLDMAAGLASPGDRANVAWHMSYPTA